MRDILTNETLVSLIDPSIENIDDAFDKLVYEKVFPLEYIPETIEDASTFLCFDVDVAKSFNKTFLSPVIHVWFFTHKSLLRLPEGGLRIDALASELSKVLNGSRYYGLGELDLYSVKRFTPLADYQGRHMTFKAKDFNRPAPSKHPIPANRKKW